MAGTQIHSNDVKPESIYNSHINANASIDGSKVKPSSEVAYGTVKLATDGESASNKVVQSNDSRLHEQGSDTGTTRTAFVVNSDHSAGENSAIELHSSTPDKGGKFVYNESTSQLEFTNNANAASPTYYAVSNVNSTSNMNITGKWSFNNSLKLPLSEPTPFTEGMVYWDTTLKNLMIHNGTSKVAVGGGVLYFEALAGSQSEDHPTNLVYRIPTGSFSLDGSNLYVFANGILKHSNIGDFSIINDTTIEFSAARKDSDILLFLVLSKGVNQDGHIQNTDTATSSKIFRIGSGFNELTNTFQIPFGIGSNSFVGFEVISGTITFTHAGGSRTVLGTLNQASNYTLSGTWQFDKAMIAPRFAGDGRPSEPQAGMIMLNTTSLKFEGYNGVEWSELS